MPAWCVASSSEDCAVIVPDARAAGRRARYCRRPTREGSLDQAFELADVARPRVRHQRPPPAPTAVGALGAVSVEKMAASQTSAALAQRRHTNLDARETVEEVGPEQSAVDHLERLRFVAATILMSTRCAP